MKRDPHRRLVLLLWSVATVSCAGRSGCGKAPSSTAVPELALLPAATRFVAVVDFQKVRTSPIWQTLTALVAEDSRDRALIDDITARTDLDPLRQVHRVLAAFPEDARIRGEYALLVDGERFDEKRLVTFARDQAQLKGQDLLAHQHGQRTLWGLGPTAPTGGFFVGSTRFVLGGGGWAEELADRVDGRGPDGGLGADGEFMGLVNRIDRSGAIWLAVVVPAATRQRLLSDPRHGVAASVTRLAGSVNLQRGLRLEVTCELSNAQDAAALAAQVQTAAREAKSNPQILMLGLGPHLDGVTARHEGPLARLRVDLSESQVKDLLTRLVAFVRLTRGTIPIHPGLPSQ